VIYICPVCGYKGLREDPREQTFEICPCCYVEFGYEDVGNTYEALRQKWIDSGAEWHSRAVSPPPKNWDYREQLKNLKESAAK
jgi:hypothetical protein